MIKRLICWLWGHSIVRKAFTGETFHTTNLMWQEHTISLYVWEKSKFCLRCGKKVGEEIE